MQTPRDAASSWSYLRKSITLLKDFYQLTFCKNIDTLQYQQLPKQRQSLELPQKSILLWKGTLRTPSSVPSPTPALPEWSLLTDSMHKELLIFLPTAFSPGTGIPLVGMLKRCLDFFYSYPRKFSVMSNLETESNPPLYFTGLIFFCVIN